MNHYIASNDFNVFKLHGSVNWHRRVDIPIRTEEDVRQAKRTLIDRAGSYSEEDIFRIAPDPVGRYEVDGGLALPALAIPTERGKEFICPSEHLERLKELLPKVTHVLVVGWRGMEEHFRDVLRQYVKGQTRLLVVSGSEESAKETALALLGTNNALRGDYSVAGGGFTTFALSRDVETFISSDVSPTYKASGRSHRRAHGAKK